MKPFFAVLAAGCVAMADAPAQTQLDMPAALAEAVANNPGLRASRARVEAATGRAIQSRLWPNPSLEFSAQQVPVNRGGFSQSENLAGVAQTVPFPGKKQLDARIGAKEISAAEWDYLVRELELVRDVKVAFWRALAAQKKCSVDTLVGNALTQSVAALLKK